MQNDFYTAYNSLSTAQKKEAYDFVLFLQGRDIPQTKDLIEKENINDIEIGPITKSLSGVFPQFEYDDKDFIAHCITERYENESIS